MPGLKPLTPRKLVRILEDNGFTFVHQKGSHRFYHRDKFVVTLPYHTKDLKMGTLKSIVKQSGLPVELFER